MSCCPKGSWQQLHAQYKTTGVDIEIEEGNRAIIIVTDIFGAKSGRHRNVADIFASLGYNVFLPELLVPPYQGPLGPALMENIKNQDQKIMSHRFEKVVKYLESKGIKQFFSIGFCWGTWYAFKLATHYEGFKAIAGPHPSLGVQKMFGGDELKLANDIRCPAYLLPALNDPPNVKQGGQIVQALAKKFGADKTGTTTFPQMIHGWVVRGDLADQKIARDANKAINLIHGYFQKFI